MRWAEQVACKVAKITQKHRHKNLKRRVHIKYAGVDERKIIKRT
jgi:hypothetical protein